MTVLSALFSTPLWSATLLRLGPLAQTLQSGVSHSTPKKRRNRSGWFSLLVLAILTVLGAMGASYASFPGSVLSQIER